MFDEEHSKIIVMPHKSSLLGIERLVMANSVNVYAPSGETLPTPILVIAKGRPNIVYYFLHFIFMF
jgi:hypothetical protein